MYQPGPLGEAELNALVEREAGLLIEEQPPVTGWVLLLRAARPLYREGRAGIFLLPVMLSPPPGPNQAHLYVRLASLSRLAASQRAEGRLDVSHGGCARGLRH